MSEIRGARVVALVAAAAATMGVDCNKNSLAVPPPIPSTSQYAICGPPSVDPVAVQDVWIDGDSVHAIVRYSGGCKTHDFTLCWDGGWISGTPMQTSMFVDHWADGDTCTEWIEESFAWDISSLREDTLDSWPAADRILIVFPSETLEYRF